MSHTPKTRATAGAKTKQRRLDWLSQNGPCQECGSWKNLEVDHIDPALKIDHRIWTWSEVRRTEELKKCQVLCYDCHLKKTVATYEKIPQIHGTVASYKRSHSPCRCDLCKKANADHEHKRRLLLTQAETVSDPSSNLGVSTGRTESINFLTEVADWPLGAASGDERISTGHVPSVTRHPVDDYRNSVNHNGQRQTFDHGRSRVAVV